jgi:acyl carrier protein
MTNLDKYNRAFIEVFAVNDSTLNDNFSKDTVMNWDSVHQLNIIALLEESFDILLEPEDIMDFISYPFGKKILAKYDVIIE